MNDRDPRTVSELYGLVLAGGHSRRFGADKAGIQIDGRALLPRIVELLRPCVAEVFVSVRVDQADDELRSDFPLIMDDAPGLGPAGGILAAQRRHPDVAWLVVACDLPRLSEGVVRSLVQSRAAHRAATAFRSAVDGRVEPLCAIYEPATLARFRRRVEAGEGLSPRDLLQSIDVEFAESADAGALGNVNTPDDLERVLK